MDMQQFAGALGETIGVKGLKLDPTGQEVSCPGNPNQPLQSFQMSRKDSNRNEVSWVVFSAETLAGPKWEPLVPHSGFEHDPQSRELRLYRYGRLFVLKSVNGKMMVFER